MGRAVALALPANGTLELLHLVGGLSPRAWMNREQNSKGRLMIFIRPPLLVFAKFWYIYSDVMLN